MNKYIWLVLACVAIFFATGLSYGLWSRRKLGEALAKSTPLRVLCADNWLSTAALDRFSHAHNTRIELWTYATPSEFLRQMANADGRVDVICTRSLLVKSLVRSHWIAKMDFQALPNTRQLSVDFTHLPYDPQSEYSAPLFWNLYGFFGKEEVPPQAGLRDVWETQHISLWGDELNIMDLMTRLGFAVESRLEEPAPHSHPKSLNDEVHRFASGADKILLPQVGSFSAEATLKTIDWVQLPLARVARLLGGDSPYHFWLPIDGGMLDLGVLSVGARAQSPAMAMQLINELISSEEAIGLHQRLESGVVNSSLAGTSSIAAMQLPQALRSFQLNRLSFPDLNVEALPSFQKVFDEKLAPKEL